MSRLIFLQILKMCEVRAEKPVSMILTWICKYPQKRGGTSFLKVDLWLG